jgi:uncharacterized membrane protein
MSCSGCKNDRAEGKLGRCAFCMNANLLGAIIGWLAFAGIAFLYPKRTAETISLLIASFFTLFFVAHVIASYRDKRTEPPAL